MKTGKVVLTFLLLLICCGPMTAHAVTLSLETSATSITVGETFSIDIFISGGELIGNALNSNPIGNDLGTFDMLLSFDNSLIDFDSYSLGDQLGDITTGDAYDLSDPYSGGGEINLTEVSLLLDLSAQSDSFVLATLSFSAIASGPASIGLSDIILGDYWGEDLTLDANPDVLSLTISESQTNPVPEPTTFMLLGIGLTGMGAAVRRQEKRS